MKCLDVLLIPVLSECVHMHLHMGARMHVWVHALDPLDSKEENSNSVRFEVSTLVTMKNAIFWDVTPCGPSKNRHFGGTYCLHHQGDKNRQARNNVSSN
jgi:hypothetical protein